MKRILAGGLWASVLIAVCLVARGEQAHSPGGANRAGRAATTRSAGSAPATRPSRPFLPTKDYQKRMVEGWTMYVNPAFAGKRPALCAAVVKEAAVQLRRVKRVVPADKIKLLQTVPIWVEYHRGKVNDAAAFHPSRRWLRNHGMNPDKAESIEIPNARNFLYWSKKSQPWTLLHELAHALHWKLFRFGNPQIHAVYKKVAKSGKLEKVMSSSGKTRRHYGLKNAKEFFAEFTETYFGRNDMYPFVRAELQRDMPEVAGMIHDIWRRPCSYVPTEKYHKRNLEGWTVLVNPDFAAAYPGLCAEVLDEVAIQLYKIKCAVPADKVKILQGTKIWVEYESISASSAAFHPYPQWLKDNGLNPDKARCVELTNAKNFIAWTKNGLPWMIFHELCHAYDWNMFRYNNPRIKAAHRRFVQRGNKTGKINRVLEFNGNTRVHNGRTNNMEYFAEFSETYFGRNEMYPFVRAQLERDDPETAKLIREIWFGSAGKSAGKPSTGKARTSHDQRSDKAASVGGGRRRAS